MEKPYSASADRNSESIAQAMHDHFQHVHQVLEIGSGSGQHAVYFSRQHEQLNWQPTDRYENLAGIRQWISESGLSNVADPLELDVDSVTQRDQCLQAVPNVELAYSCNTAHIMSLGQVQQTFDLVGKALVAGGCYFLYGPFCYDGEHTAASNAQFDAMLRQQSEHMGVRDKTGLDEFALQCGLVSCDEIIMPANNRILCWKKT